ncbi:MAG: hypothetical protein ACRDS0_02550 [Pseudonocardiaceae bacterium]
MRSDERHCAVETGLEVVAVDAGGPTDGGAAVGGTAGVGETTSDGVAGPGAVELVQPASAVAIMASTTKRGRQLLTLSLSSAVLPATRQRGAVAVG